MAASGWRDALCSLEKVLQTVGGGVSHFAALLKCRMLETDLPISIPRELPLPNSQLQIKATPYTMERFLEAADIYEVETVCGDEKLASVM